MCGGCKTFRKLEIKKKSKGKQRVMTEHFSRYDIEMDYIYKLLRFEGSA